MKKINKNKAGTMGPKRKPAPKPIVSNTAIAKRVRPWSYILGRQVDLKKQHKTKDVGKSPQPYIQLNEINSLDLRKTVTPPSRKQRKRKNNKKFKNYFKHLTTTTTMINNKPKFLKAKLTKTNKGFTKRAGTGEQGMLGLKNKTNRKFTAEYGKSIGAQIGAGLAAGAIGASAGAAAGIGVAAAGTRTAGNLIQQKVAKRRTKKFGQAGSAIVANKSFKGDKAMAGEKTFTHSTAKASRKSARATRGLIRYDARQRKKENKAMANKPMAKFPDLSGDGKVTKKDILIGRGVIDKPKMLVKKRKDYV